MGAIRFDGRSAALAAATSLTEANGVFPIPGPRGGKLVQFSISIGATSGPVSGVLQIFRGGVNTDVIVLSDQFVLRSTSLGAIPDVFSWLGDADYPGGSSLRIFLRNDSGSAVFWAARWAVEIA